MREHVLKDLANRAATDPEFLGQVRRDLEGTLAQSGYHLTDEELQLVKNLQRQTAGMSNPRGPPPRVGVVRGPRDRRDRRADGSGGRIGPADLSLSSTR